MINFSMYDMQPGDVGYVPSFLVSKVGDMYFVDSGAAVWINGQGNMWCKIERTEDWFVIDPCDVEFDPPDGTFSYFIARKRDERES